MLKQKVVRLLLVVCLIGIATSVFATEPSVPGPAGSCNSTYPALPEEMRTNLLNVVQTATDQGIATDSRFGFFVQAARLDTSSTKLNISSGSSLLCSERVVVTEIPVRYENGYSGWSPYNLPIEVTANAYSSGNEYDEQSLAIYKTINLSPGAILISGAAEITGPETSARFGLKIDGVEVALTNGSYNHELVGDHLVELYVYAYDVYGDVPSARITGISIPTK